MTTQAPHREEEVLGRFRVNSPLLFPQSPSERTCHLVLGLAEPRAGHRARMAGTLSLC